MNYDKPKKNKLVMVAAIVAGLVLLLGSVLPFLPYVLSR